MGTVQSCQICPPASAVQLKRPGSRKCLLGLFLAGAGEGVFPRRATLGTTTAKSPWTAPSVRGGPLCPAGLAVPTVPSVQAPGSLRLLGGGA